MPLYCGIDLHAVVTQQSSTNRGRGFSGMHGSDILLCLPIFSSMIIDGSGAECHISSWSMSWMVTRSPAFACDLFSGNTIRQFALLMERRTDDFWLPVVLT